MGLDTVELILRTEEVFGVLLSDDDCSHVVTVSDLYRLVLNELKLPYKPASAVEDSTDGFRGRNRLHAQFPGIERWTTPDVWLTLKALILDQLALRDDEVHEFVRFSEDLLSD